MAQLKDFIPETSVLTSLDAGKAFDSIVWDGTVLIKYIASRWSLGRIFEDGWSENTCTDSDKGGMERRKNCVFFSFYGL